VCSEKPTPAIFFEPAFFQIIPLFAVTLHATATTLASKGLGAANRLIVACDTLKLRATSACASPLESR
jgi:hypothetical protein